MNDVHSQDSESRILRAVWGLPTPPARGPRAKYGVSDVAAAAVSLADADGLAGVVLSAVAAELQLTTTALYRYVDSKETLVELMVDAALGPAPTLDAADWRAGVEAWVRALWMRYREHPWIAEVPLAGMPRHPQRLGWMEASVAGARPRTDRRPHAHRPASRRRDALLRAPRSSRQPPRCTPALVAGGGGWSLSTTCTGVAAGLDQHRGRAHRSHPDCAAWVGAHVSGEALRSCCGAGSASQRAVAHRERAAVRRSLPGSG